MVVRQIAPEGIRAHKPCQDGVIVSAGKIFKSIRSFRQSRRQGPKLKCCGGRRLLIAQSQYYSRKAVSSREKRIVAGFRFPACVFSQAACAAVDERGQVVLKVDTARCTDFNRVLAVFGQMLRNVVCNVLVRNGHQSSLLDQPAFKSIKAEKLIDPKMLEQLIRVPMDAGCSRGSQSDPLLSRVVHLRAI